MEFRIIGCHPAPVVYNVPDSSSPERPERDCPDYPLGLDAGQVSPGHRLIAEGFCLHSGYLTLFYSFTGGVPENWEPSTLHLNAWYDADVSPSSANLHGSIGCSAGRVEGTDEFEEPPEAATVAWFDFFPLGFDTIIHVDKHWVPDSDYFSHRLSRLTIDLDSRTGSIELFR